MAARRLVDIAASPAAGRVAEIGGPEEWESRHLARAYLDAARRRRILVPAPVRGGIAFPFRNGDHLASVQAENTRTWQMYLRQHFGGAPRGR